MTPLMNAPHILTDTNTLARNRKRADPAALFLQAAAADEIQDRLAMVNRAFTAPVIVTPFPSIWRNRLPGARLLTSAEHLPLDPASCDLIIHAMDLHWANDPVGQLIQCRRALRPDGLLMVATLGGQTLHELRSCLSQAEVSLAGGLSPRVAPMGEVRDLGALLQRAGLALPVADVMPLRVEYRDLHHLMHDLRAMGETNALTARHRLPPPRRLFDRAAALYRDHFPAQGSRILATFELVFLTGWHPADSQQKPLRPGSAQHRLAQALGVAETPLSD